MAMMTLTRMLGDLGRFVEGDGELHERLAPGATVEDIEGRSCVVNWLKVDRAEQSLNVGAAMTPSGERILVRRTWYEGMDVWEASGRSSDPEVQPRLVGADGIRLDLDPSQPEVLAFRNAVTMLHLAMTEAPRRGPAGAAIQKGYERVERAMAAIDALDLRRAGVPGWLIAGTDEDPPAPAM